MKQIELDFVLSPLGWWKSQDDEYWICKSAMRKLIGSQHRPVGSRVRLWAVRNQTGRFRLVDGVLQKNGKFLSGVTSELDKLLLEYTKGKPFEIYYEDVK